MKKMKRILVIVLCMVISLVSVEGISADEQQTILTKTTKSVYKLNVPYYNQYDAGAPMGCEAASLLQALHYKGCAKEYNLKSFLKVMPYSKNDNPYEGYSGTPYKYLPYPTYQSIFPVPLTKWANQYGNAENISGCKVSVLQNEIREGNPVVVYMSYNYEKPQWNKYPWGIGMDNMHVVTLCGYDEVNNKYQVCDPVKGKYWVRESDFERSFSYLKWAVSIRTLDLCESYGHDYSDFKVTVKPTDSTPGERIKSCKRCNHEVREQLIAHVYSDVNKNEWYYSSVTEASKLGLMTGLDNGDFGINISMNRAMVACVFHRMEGNKKVAYSNVFSDVKDGQYYTTSVMWAKANGVINGYKNGTYKPLQNITREEMAVMLYNFAEYKGVDTRSDKDLTQFTDYNQISDYAIPAVKWAIENGLISGKLNGTKIDPKATATRAECAKMLVEAFNTIYK